MPGDRPAGSEPAAGGASERLKQAPTALILWRSIFRYPEFSLPSFPSRQAAVFVDSSISAAERQPRTATLRIAPNNEEVMKPMRGIIFPVFPAGLRGVQG